MRILIILYIKQSACPGISSLSINFGRVVPENVQKKQARDAKLLKELKDRRDKERKERAEKRKALVSNAEKYHNEYRAAEQTLVDEQRKAKAAGNFFVPAEHKIAFAIRTRG